LTRPNAKGNFIGMTASQIIQRIKDLDPEAQAEVIRFAVAFQVERKLSGGELASLAGRLADAPTSEEATILREKLERGFYGAKPGA
jgi:hypothetical protein